MFRAVLKLSIVFAFLFEEAVSSRQKDLITQPRSNPSRQYHGDVEAIIHHRHLPRLSCVRQLRRIYAMRMRLNALRCQADDGRLINSVFSQPQCYCLLMAILDKAPENLHKKILSSQRDRDRENSNWNIFNGMSFRFLQTCLTTSPRRGSKYWREKITREGGRKGTRQTDRQNER